MNMKVSEIFTINSVKGWCTNNPLRFAPPAGLDPYRFYELISSLFLLFIPLKVSS